MNDAPHLGRVAVEIATKQVTFDVVFRPITVLQLTGLLQLALRHPDVHNSVREAAETWLTGVRVYFDDCPAVLDLIRRGDDPAEDR